MEEQQSQTFFRGHYGNGLCNHFRKGAEYGIGVAVPIGLLLTQLDILGRMANTFFQHKADRYAEEGNYKGVERCNVLGIFPWTISRVIPVLLA